jgi:hypothetical protein
MSLNRSARRRLLRRAMSVLLLGALVMPPVTLLPTVVAAEKGSIWPFSLVPASSWRRVAPDIGEAGSVVPVSFRLGGFRGLDVLVPDPSSMAVDCRTGAGAGAGTGAHTEARAESARPWIARAKGILTYDEYTESYTFWWPQPVNWAGTCRSLILTLNDGTERVVFVDFDARHLRSGG